MRQTVGRGGLGLLSVVLLAASLAASAAPSQPALAGRSIKPSDHNKVPSDVEDLADKLTRDLKKKHYEVRQGYMKLWTQADCDKYGYPIMKSCMANNPAAPYVLSVVPSWPDEFVDPATRNAF
ncbi:MAG: hypothetical protein WEC34_13570, partial [Acidimicrobiia bacterium]